LDRVVELPDQLCDASQLCSWVQMREPVGPNHVSWHESQDFAPLVVNAQWARCRSESHLVQVGEQGMDCRRPRPGGTANGVSDANDSITDVAAGQRLFLMLHWTSVSGRPRVVTA
jgi:hypothetical protein